jgi:hypothetical protein
LLARDGTLDRSDIPRDDPGPVGELCAILSAVTQWALGRSSCYAIPASIPWLGLGETTYRDPLPPEGMLRFAAALIQKSFTAALREAEERRANARSLLEGVEPNPYVRSLQLHPEGTPGFLRLPVRVSQGASAFAGAGSKRLGIAASYPSTLALLPQLMACMASPCSPLPGGEELSRNLVTLPTHSQLNSRELDQLLSWLNSPLV